MKKTSFSVKLMCYIVVVSMVAVVISTLMISSRVTAIMEDNMSLTSEQTMNEAVSGFQRYMKTLSLPIDLMCRSNDFKKVDEEYDARIKGIEDSLLSALKVIPDSEKTYYSTGSGKYIQAKLVVDAETGKKTGDYVEDTGIDNSQKNWYKDAMGLKARYTVFGNFTVPYVNDDGITVFTVSQDLKASDIHVGVVAMDINVKVLEEYINEIQLMTTGFTFLADDDGNIIVDNARNAVIRNPSSDIPVWNELVAQAEAELAGDASAEVNPSASMTCSIKGEKYSVTLIKDTITGWYLIGLIGEDELAGSMRAISLAAVLCCVFALILSVVVALIIASSIAKELKKLQTSTWRAETFPTSWKSGGMTSSGNWSTILTI